MLPTSPDEDRPQAGDKTPPAGGPVLLVRAEGSQRMLHGGASYRIGRDPQSDIVLTDPRVSWRHASLRLDGGTWLLEDAGSTNGTFSGPDRVAQLTITGDCEVRLGHALTGPALSCSVTEAPPKPQDTALASVVNASMFGTTAAHVAAGRPGPPTEVPPAAPAGESGIGSPGSHRAPTSVLQLAMPVLRIGRASDNDVVVADLSVSRHHAELRRTPGGYQIADLDSYNGTFVNGGRVSSSPVTEADVIGVGLATFRLVGDQLQQFIDTGDISLDARGLSVTLPGGKVILDDVSFPLGERCLLGVIGPSGAGKSTLLGALTGLRPATAGTVLYDGRDLYQHYPELRYRIGLVPQENILHTQLTPRRALRYAAELRFPEDTSAAERERRIEEVLAELALTPHADTRTDKLSGGQCKRVNVALELLTKPSLLFLDEPTSGLDPGLDASVMEMLAGLAHDGRTVIVVTHSVANLNDCDRLLVLVPGGRVAFFGPPADGLTHFGKRSWAQVFQAFEAEPDRDWAGEFRDSPLCARYVTAPFQAIPADEAAGRAVPPPPRPQDRFSQLSTLARRYLAVISADRNYLAVLGLLPVILGVLSRAVPDAPGLAGRNNGNAQQVLLVLVMAACLTGTANSVREIVKERAIYTRERAAGLSAGAYLWSKLTVLGVISAVQAVIIVLIGVVGRPLPPSGALLTAAPLAELLLAMAVLAIVSMTIGLGISALVNSSDKTMPLLVVAVMLQVVLSGGVFPLNGKTGLQQLAWLSPSRWGFGAAASTVNLNVVGPPNPAVAPDPLWRHTAHTWLLDMGMQILLGVIVAALTWWRLNRLRPGRR
ncbi:MAG: FHA domain-containing protein [Streptosporangiaceae bacterium]